MSLARMWHPIAAVAVGAVVLLPLAAFAQAAAVTSPAAPAGSALSGAPRAVGPVNAPDAPAAFTLRYAARGWADLVQAGASVLTCAAGPDATVVAACRDGADLGLPTGWLDVDGDASTVNSSSATVSVPPEATVDWAGLYWGGDTGVGSPLAPQCAGSPAVALPATTPDALITSQVFLTVNGSGYQTVRAGSLTAVTSPGGAQGFQAYADITGLLRPYGRSRVAQRVPLMVGNVAVAYGPGCVGGWVALVAYSYHDGPHQTFAESYRSIQVFDGIVPAVAGLPQAIQLDGAAANTGDDTLPQGLAEDPETRLSTSILASGQAVAATGLSVSGTPVTLAANDATTVDSSGSGYHLGTAQLPAGAPPTGSGVATAAFTAQRDAFVAAVIVLSSSMNVRVDLSVTSTATPVTVPVGSITTLTIAVHNDSDLPTNRVAVTTRLPVGLALTQSVAGYDGVSGVWTVGALAPGRSAQLALLVRVDRLGILTGNVELTASAVPDVDSTPDDQVTTEDDYAEIRVVGAPAAARSTAGPFAAGATNGGMGAPLVVAALLGVGLFLLGAFILFVLMIRAKFEND